MKKFILSILLYITFFQLNAQFVTWGNLVKLNEIIYGYGAYNTGKYLGNINGKDYYTYFGFFNNSFKIPNQQLSFIETNETIIKRFTSLTEKRYKLIDVFIVAEQIGVFHIIISKSDTVDIKYDLYSPNSFKNVKSISLTTFQSIHNQYPFMKMIHSKNNQYVGFIAIGINPLSGNKTLILKCFDHLLNEIWSTYYDDFNNSFLENGKYLITNDGKIVFQFVNYYLKNYASNKRFTFVEIFKDKIKKVNYDFENPNINIIDFKLDYYGDNNYFSVYTQENKVIGCKIEFENQEVYDIFSYQPTHGNWQIDEVLDLKNGKYIVALQNRDVSIIEYDMKKSYNYWSNSFLFIGFDSDNYDIFLKKYLGRKLIVHGSENSDFHISKSPFYFVNDNNLFVVYNTSKNTKDFVLSLKENETSLLKSKYYPSNIDTRIAKISENGTINVTVLFNSENDQGMFLTNFTHIINNENVILVKAKKKKIILGKVKL